MTEEPAIQRAEPRAWASLVFLAGIVAAVAWRVPWLWRTPLWIDEGFTWRDIQKPVRMMIGWVHHTTHPPLMYMLVKFTTRVLGGEAEWQLRVVSFSSWLATIAAGYVLGRVMHSRLAGWCLALVLSLEPVMAKQGTEARMHMLSLLFTLLAIAFAGRLLERSEQRVRGWLVLSLLLAGVYWSSASGVYLAPTILGGAALCLWRQRRGQFVETGQRAEPTQAWRSIGLAALFWVALCHVGLLKQVMNQRTVDAGDELVRSWSDALRLFAKFPEMIANVPWVGAVIVAAGLAGLILLSVRRVQTARLALLVVVVNVVACALLSKVHLDLWPRYFMPASAMVWLGAAVLGVEAWRRWRGAALLLPACAGLLLWSALTWMAERDNMGARLKEIVTLARPGESIVVFPDWMFYLSDYYVKDVPTIRAYKFEPFDEAHDELMPASGMWVVASWVKDEPTGAIGERQKRDYDALRALLAGRYEYVYPLGESDARSRVTLYSHEAARFGGPVPEPVEARAEPGAGGE